MTMTTTYTTKDIDQVACIATVCGVFPVVLCDGYDGQAIFEFNHTPEIQAALIDFATGTTTANARRLLATRRRLFHEVRIVTARGQL